MSEVKEYIEKNWDLCIKENMEDEGTLIGLPYPYTVPAVGHFNEMYYWDTYFTNKGLELSDRFHQAKFNVDNMLYMVEKIGFMPNGNRTYYLKRSQPPFLSEMVKDIYEHFKDKVWLLGAYETLKKEYDFWINKRTTPAGLSGYKGDAEFDTEYWATTFGQRVSADFDITKEEAARHFLCAAESGWDINPRWETEGYNYAQVDLNSLLYMMEINMGYFAGELSLDNDWADRAEKRKVLMTKLMENEEGLILDYNFDKDKKSSVFSAATLYALFSGVATKEQAEAIVKNLHRLEAPYGILTCEKNDFPGSYQWDYPNGWACIQYIAIMGLDKYGYKEEAKRIAEKYLKLVEKVFSATGNLWEKYNVVEGNINVTNEYGLPPMMGWSAGVYLAASKYIENN